MKVQRKVPLADAIQYKDGIPHPFVTMRAHDGKPVINTSHGQACMVVQDGDWIVREPGRIFDSLYSDEKFRERFHIAEGHLGSIAEGGVAVQNFFDEADVNSMRGGGGPLAIMVSSWAHNGKTLIGSSIESMLKGFGFKNVTVHAPEDPQEIRASMIGQIIEMQDQPSAQALFNKPIRIFEANAGIPKRFKESKKQTTE